MELGPDEPRALFLTDGPTRHVFTDDRTDAVISGTGEQNTAWKFTHLPLADKAQVSSYLTVPISIATANSSLV